MPGYTGFHTISTNSVASTNHFYKIINQAVQGCYSVTYPQFWINEAVTTTYDFTIDSEKEFGDTDRRLSRQECKIIPIEPALPCLDKLENRQKDQAWFLQEDGTLQLRYSFVMVVSYPRHPLKVRRPDNTVVPNLIIHHQGKEIRHTEEDCVIVAFTSADNMLDCALAIREQLNENNTKFTKSVYPISFKISIAGSTPDTQEEKHSHKTIRLGQRLNSIAEDRQIVSTHAIERISDFNKSTRGTQAIRVINASEEQFLNSLFDISETYLDHSDFNVESLCRRIGISRPQLYRKIRSITGTSPNVFIKNLRMKKAMFLIQKRQYTISEIALEVGISNPSYFSKCFREEYGIMPSQLRSLEESLSISG